MVMKREVVGYTTMSEHLIDTQLTHSPFFFASANQSMLGCGVAHAFQQAIPFAELANQAKQLLQQAKRDECDNPLLFGIVPFDPKTPTRFMIPRTLYVSSSPRLNRPAHLTRQVAKLISSPSGEQYKQGVSHLLNMFHHSGCLKWCCRAPLKLPPSKRSHYRPCCVICSRLIITAILLRPAWTNKES